MQQEGPGVGGKGINIMVVDESGRGHTHATTIHEDKVANEDGHYWTIDIDAITAAGAGDFFFYLKNEGSVDIGITDWRGFSTVINQIDIMRVNGDPTYVGGGTNISPTARKLGQGSVPDATIKTDTDITGLTEHGRLFFLKYDTADKTFHDKTTANIIIPQGQAIAFKRIEATGAVTINLSLIQYDTGG